MLTQAGSAFLDEAKDILKRVNRAKTSAQQAARGETGNLTIGFISLADYNLMPYVLREFQKKYPKQATKTLKTIWELVEKLLLSLKNQ